MIHRIGCYHFGEEHFEGLLPGECLSMEVEVEDYGMHLLTHREEHCSKAVKQPVFAGQGQL